jgi:hypothetical protein
MKRKKLLKSRDTVLILLVVYFIFKIYALKTPTQSDDCLPDQIGEALLKTLVLQDPIQTDEHASNQT